MSSAHYSHYRCSQPSSLSDFLQTFAGLSSARIETLLRFGAIYINGERIRMACEVTPEDVIRVHFQPKRFLIPEKIEVVYEDEDFLAIDKPSGLPTHPTLDNYLENASLEMQKRLGKKLYVTHRLDIGTEGILIFAKSPESQVAFNRLLEKRRVQKIYRALTEHPVPVGRFEHHMQIDHPTPKPVFSEPVENSCNAILIVRNSWQVKDGFACEMELETGRTHQIRAQLSFLGCPILGDALYGGAKKSVHERLALECLHISFTHRSRTIGIYRPTPLVGASPLSDH